jgi:hypothetical protein
MPVLAKLSSGSSTRLPTMVVWLSAAICLLLKVVAVAGRRVSHQLLAAVAGLDDRQLDGALRAAVTSQLLVARPGQDGYDLCHALLREVIDADLLPGERARLRAALANLLGSGELDWSDSPPRCRGLGPGARSVKGAGVVGANGLRQLGIGVVAAVTSGLGRLFGTVVG